MKSSQNSQNERFDCPFLKIRTDLLLRIETLIRASEWITTCSDLVWRSTTIGFPLII